jgi:hypothetical protein
MIGDGLVMVNRRRRFRIFLSGRIYSLDNDIKSENPGVRF